MKKKWFGSKNLYFPKKKFWIIIALVLMTIAFFHYQKPAFQPGEPFTEREWQENYALQASKQIPDYGELIMNTEYYDYNNKAISDVAESIASKSGSAEEAISNANKYVYDNVKYVYGEADNACFDATAPTVLQSGNGQCDTQSIVLISLLRKMGVIAQPVGGCIVMNKDYALQSMFLQAFEDISKTPKYSELTDADLLKEQIGRGNALSRKGGLHAWVNTWTLNDGWITLEVTSGKIADTERYYYHVELLPENDEKTDICVSKNWNYAKACKNNNLDIMDQQGLGLINEVLN